MNKKQILSKLICLFPVIIYSCDSADLFPDQVTNEVKVECTLSDHKDNTASLDLWVEIKTTHGMAIIDTIGICWNFNTENLPTVRSAPIKTPYQNNYFYGSYLTSIPVTSANYKIIIRGFAILNDSIIRYSLPLVLNNPADYAN